MHSSYLWKIKYLPSLIEYLYSTERVENVNNLFIKFNNNKQKNIIL